MHLLRAGSDPARVMHLRGINACAGRRCGIMPRMRDPILERTIEDLVGERWGSPTSDSHLVTEAHRLRGLPLGELTVEDLRLLIGQDIGTRWLMPVALALLEVDPLAEGDFYPGDLLSSVLSVKAEYWTANPDELAALDRIRDMLETLRRSSTELFEGRDWPPVG